MITDTGSPRRNPPPSSANSGLATVMIWPSGAVTVFTDQPGVQFYSGTFLDGTTALRDGSRVRQGAAFCLETQQSPNSPTSPASPARCSVPESCHRSRIVLRFSPNDDAWLVAAISGSGVRRAL